MTTANQVKAFTQGLVVLRRIDSGREVGFWLVRMTAPELEEWWINQETFEDNPDGAFDELHRALGRTPPPHSSVHYRLLATRGRGACQSRRKGHCGVSPQEAPLGPTRMC